MFHCRPTISHVILNSMFEYSANLDLPLRPLLKITDQSASDVSVGLSHSTADRLFTYLGCCRQGNMAGKINPYDYEPEYSDDEDIGNVNVDKYEVRNAADVMSDCSEGNSPLPYLDLQCWQATNRLVSVWEISKHRQVRPSVRPPSLPPCLSAPPPLFRHNRVTATKFGTHIYAD